MGYCFLNQILIAHLCTRDWIHGSGISEDQDRPLSAWEGGIPFGLEKIVVLKKEKK